MNKLLYVFLCIFGFVNLTKGVGSLFISKEIFTLVSFFFLFASFFCVVKKVRFFDAIDALLFFVISVLFFHFALYVYVCDVSYITIPMKSLIQLEIPLILAYVYRRASGEVLAKVADYLSAPLMLLMIIGFMEFLLPGDIRAMIYSYSNYLSGGDLSVPVSYYLGDSSFAGYRVGSILFEPLTYAYIVSFVFIFRVSNGGRIISLSLFSLLTSLGKLPILGAIMAVLVRAEKRLGRLIICMWLVSYVVAIVFFSNYFINNSYSMGAHFSGLMYGVKSIFDSPLGNGFGTSGYLPFLSYLSVGEKGPFVGNSIVENGNESAIGVVFYQIGFLGILYISVFVAILFDVIKKAGALRGVIVASFIASLFLSESALSVTVLNFMFLYSYASSNK